MGRNPALCANPLWPWLVGGQATHLPGPRPAAGSGEPGGSRDLPRTAPHFITAPVAPAWPETAPWRALGVAARPLAILWAFLGGLLKALLLLALVAGALLVGGNAQWRGLAALDGGEALNAIALMVGVGFAEELVFRGWLWGELQRLMAPQAALLMQAAIFAVVHPWSQDGWLGAVGLLVGLILLGLNLALQRPSRWRAALGCHRPPRRTGGGLVCPASRFAGGDDSSARLADRARRQPTQPHRRTGGVDRDVPAFGVRRR